MVGEMRINDAGLQEASSGFSLLSEEIAQTASAYRTDGDVLRGSWKGVGSDTFSKYFDIVGKLMEKTSFGLESESQAVLSANERFKDADRRTANFYNGGGSGFSGGGGVR